MTQEIQIILGLAARRLRHVRMIEAAAVASAAGAVSACWTQAAWIVAPAWAAGGVALCVAASIAMAALMAVGAVRRRLGVTSRLAAVLAGVFLAGGIHGAMCIALGWHAIIPRMALPAAMISLGALCGVAAAIASGKTAAQLAAQAAAIVDLKCGLNQTLMTAADLSAAGATDGLAQEVYRRAVQAAQVADVRRTPMWRRTSATAGAWALAVAIAMTLAMLPALPPPAGANVSPAGPALNWDRMTAQQKQALIDGLLAAAKQAASQPAHSGEVQIQFDRAVVAIRDGHPQTAQEALAILAAAGIRVREIASAAGLSDQPDAAGAPDPTAAGNTGSHANNPAVEPSAKTPPDKGAPGVPASPAVTSPAGGAEVPVAAVPGAPAPAGTLPPGGPRLATGAAWSDAWQAARIQAADRLGASQVAPKHRQLVRDFFDLDAADEHHLDR